MKKALLAALAGALVVTLALPAFATEIKANGWIGTKTSVSQRTGLGQIYPTKDMTTYRYTHMRARLRFEMAPSDVAGLVWYNEIDYDFGGQAYFNGRGKGGGLGSDTTNLETKQLHLYFKVPTLHLSAKAGIDWIADDFDWAVLGNDTAGYQFAYANEGIKAKFGYYNLWYGKSSTIIDDVDFYMLSGSMQLDESTKVGLAGYYLKDGSGHAGNGLLSISGVSLTNGVASLSHNASTGFSSILPGGATYTLNSYYLGVTGDTAVGPVKLHAWGVYNFGTVDMRDTGVDNIDISGFASNLRASGKAADVSWSVDGLYVSGSNKDTDEKFGFTNTGMYSAGSNFFFRQGMMILLPDGGDWNYSSAYAYNISNVYEDRFLGLTGLFAQAKTNLPNNFMLKAAIGGMMSSQKRQINGNSYMGTEVNSRITYNINKNALLELNLAYAFTGNFYEVSASEATGGVAANTDPDDVFYGTLGFKVRF